MPNPTPEQRQSPSEATTPGAERFWGQFSQAGRGREDEPGDDFDPSGTEGQDADAARPEGDNDPGAERQNHHSAGHGDCLEWCPICRSAELIRSAVTPELREQAESLQREALNVFQAFLEVYSQHAGRSASGGKTSPSSSEGKSGESRTAEPEITDIPLD